MRARLGGGAGLAIGCDMIVAGTDLKFGYPELKHSIVPALVMTGLQRHLGRKLAFELVSTGRLLGAEEPRSAWSTGSWPDEVFPAALEIAEPGGPRWSPLAMAAAKDLFYRVADLPSTPRCAPGATSTR